MVEIGSAVLAAAMAAAVARVAQEVAKVLIFIIVKIVNRITDPPLAGFVPLGSDQEKIDAMAEAIEHRLGPDVGTRLMEMDLEERKEALRWLAQETARIMGITDMPEIEFLDSGELGEAGAHIAGRYIFVLNRLQINQDYLKVQNEKILLDALDTVIHEMCHAYQFMKMEEMLEMLEGIQTEEEKQALESDPENGRTLCWIANRMPGRYIDFRVDPEGYRNQPLENYAFGMANVVMRKLLEGKDEQ